MCCHFRCVDATFELQYAPPADFFACLPTGVIEQVPLPLKARMIAGAVISATELASTGYAVTDRSAAEQLTTMTANRSPRLIRAIMASINNSISLDRNAALAQESLLFREIAANGALQ
jgi:predicted anti-sigma-YlaC factor YlaD